jgi:HD-like signal output (HDOD) protein
MPDSILQKIRKVGSLPSAPTVAVEVLRLAQDQEVSLTEIGTVIELDPALTAKILKVVNSPVSGVSSEVSSLTRAIALLGLRTVKILALGFSLIDSIRGEEDPEFHFNCYGAGRLRSRSVPDLSLDLGIRNSPKRHLQPAQ